MRAVNAFGRWSQPAIPASRLARLGVIAYLFVPLDMLFANRWIALHGQVPSRLYQPVMIARLLNLPTPTMFWVNLIQVLTVGAALSACAVMLAKRRVPVALDRTLRAIVPIGYLWWMFVAMSYGKVDHDRIGYITLLIALACVPRLAAHDHTPDTQSGWLLRMVQISVMATYFLAAFAKVRFGGWAWMNGATLSRAVIRRGTYWSNWLIEKPGILRASQWAILWGEFLSPAIFFIRRKRTIVITVFCLFGFHLMTFMALRIVFLPHCVALCSFLPLEDIRLRTRSMTSNVA